MVAVLPLNDTLTLQGRRLFLPGGPQDSMRSIGPPSMVRTCATDALPIEPVPMRRVSRRSAS